MRTVAPALTEAVRTVIHLVADAEWSVIERLAPGSRVGAVDLQRAVRSYGRTLVHAPLDLARFVDVVECADSHQVSAPLWTLEEGRSDLELRLTAHEVQEGLWSLQVDDVLVP